MNKRNVQKELDALLEKLPKDKPPRLLLHACCAPCSSYVLEYLSQYFFITLLFYNPNISPQTEYEKRYAELLRLVKEQPHRFPVSVVPCGYDPESFFSAVHGLESLPEGGARCARVLSYASGGGGSGGKGRRLRLFYHHAFDQPVKGR